MPEWSDLPWSARLILAGLTVGVLHIAFAVHRIEQRLAALHRAYLKRFHDIDG